MPKKNPGVSVAKNCSRIWRVLYWKTARKASWWWSWATPSTIPATKPPEQPQRSQQKDRDAEDILIACVDGLSGFPNAVEAVFPQPKMQQCIIHQILNTTRFVSYKDIKKLMET